jgi:hypothetical protein
MIDTLIETIFLLVTSLSLLLLPLGSIDTFSETIISIADAAKHVGKISGKNRNRSVIFRWISRGVSGVKLEAIRIGGEIFTSKEALNDFLNRSREARTKRHSVNTANGIRRAKNPNVEAEAEELGI